MKYIVGDIHGELTKLKGLLRAILQKDGSPELIFIGDYLDKGEDPFQTLNFLVDLQRKYPCTFLWGNHEYLWMNFKEGDAEAENYLMKYGARHTIASLSVSNIHEAKRKLSDSFGDFFLNLKPYWIGQKHVVVHSGIKPEDYHKPIEQLGVSRLIFNRYDFIAHENLYMGKYRVVFGHTGFYSPYVDSFKTGIDTAACYLEEQPITAYSPDTDLFIDSAGREYGLNTIPLNCCPCIPRTKPFRIC